MIQIKQLLSNKLAASCKREKKTNKKKTLRLRLTKGKLSLRGRKRSRRKGEKKKLNEQIGSIQ